MKDVTEISCKAAFLAVAVASAGEHAYTLVRVDEAKELLLAINALPPPPARRDA